MGWLRQIAAITLLNLRTIPQRLSSSAVAIVGIAGVVVVFVSVLSIAAGFSAAMQTVGSPERALVMRSGADTRDDERARRRRGRRSSSRRRASGADAQRRSRRPSST